MLKLKLCFQVLRPNDIATESDTATGNSAEMNEEQVENVVNVQCVHIAYV